MNRSKQSRPLSTDVGTDFSPLAAFVSLCDEMFFAVVPGIVETDTQPADSENLHEHVNLRRGFAVSKTEFRSATSAERGDLSH
jgi:hypothetical protein